MTGPPPNGTDHIKDGTVSDTWRSFISGLTVFASIGTILGFLGAILGSIVGFLVTADSLTKSNQTLISAIEATSTSLHDLKVGMATHASSNRHLQSRIESMSAKLGSLELTSESLKVQTDNQDSQLTRILTRTECGDLQKKGEAACKESLRKYHRIYVAHHRPSEHKKCDGTCSQPKLNNALTDKGFVPDVTDDFAFWLKGPDSEEGRPVGLIIEPSMSRGDACKVIEAAKEALGSNLEYLALNRGRGTHESVVGVSPCFLKDLQHKRLAADQWKFCERGDQDTLIDAVFRELSVTTPAPIPNCTPSPLS